MSGAAWTCTTSASTSLPPMPEDAVTRFSKSARVCQLPHRYDGPCQLQDHRQDAKRPAGSLLA